jgi:hypothetical protein
MKRLTSVCKRTVTSIVLVLTLCCVHVSSGHRHPASRLRPAQYMNPYQSRDRRIPSTTESPSPITFSSSRANQTPEGLASPVTTPVSSASWSASSSVGRPRTVNVPIHEHFPCRDLIRQPIAAQTHCECRRDEHNSTELNCEHVRLPMSAQFGIQLQHSNLPLDTLILRRQGLQQLPAHLFAHSSSSSSSAVALQVKRLDLRHNLLRRLSQRSFDGIEPSLQQLLLGHNLLGDQLNPIFATNEFFALTNLRLLDLSHNQLRALDSNLFAGLRNLTVSNSFILNRLFCSFDCVAEKRTKSFSSTVACHSLRSPIPQPTESTVRHCRSITERKARQSCVLTDQSINVTGTFQLKSRVLGTTTLDIVSSSSRTCHVRPTTVVDI